LLSSPGEGQWAASPINVRLLDGALSVVEAQTEDWHPDEVDGRPTSSKLERRRKMRALTRQARCTVSARVASKGAGGVHERRALELGAAALMKQNKARHEHWVRRHRPWLYESNDRAWSSNGTLHTEASRGWCAPTYHQERSGNRVRTVIALAKKEVRVAHKQRLRAAQDQRTERREAALRAQESLAAAKREGKRWCESALECMMCGEEEARMMALPCRHTALCRACWASAERVDEVCAQCGVKCELMLCVHRP
jgi:hypothetical protein